MKIKTIQKLCMHPFVIRFEWQQKFIQQKKKNKKLFKKKKNNF